MQNTPLAAGLLLLSVCHGGQAAASPETAAKPPSRACPENTLETGGQGAKSAKREGPADVPPVVVGKLKFVAIQWGKHRCLGQNGGYIAAYDVATGQELWLLKVYTVKYDPRREPDTQDVFIQSMAKTPDGKLEITDENGRAYRVNPRSRTVKPHRP